MKQYGLRGGILGAALLGLGLGVAAEASAVGAPPDPTALIDDAFVEDVRAMLSEEIVIRSVEFQNALYGRMSGAEIASLDRTWRAEREARRQPLITRRLSSPLSIYLLRIQAQSLGLFTEIFVTDANGLNVGQSAVTSDFWQGDEDKFQLTFDEGADAVFIDVAEWHEGSATWRAQLNLTVKDPATNRPLGAATFEVNLTELLRRGPQ
ncbi:MAG: hypothetical protein AAF318_14495 [Pseudomonadota bacterium]